MLRRRSVTRLLAAAALVTGTLTGLAPSATAATCSGTACFTLNPDAYGCTGAVTKGTKQANQVYDGRIVYTFTASLRYSSRCGGQAWMRATWPASEQAHGYFMVQSCTLVVGATQPTCDSTKPVYTQDRFRFSNAPVVSSHDLVTWSGMVPTYGRRYRICSRTGYMVYAQTPPSPRLDHFGGWSCSSWY